MKEIIRANRNKWQTKKKERKGIKVNERKKEK
jgi:hypothetical protein